MVERVIIVEAIKIPAVRVIKIASIFLVGTIVGFVLSKETFFMMLQLLLAAANIICTIIVMKTINKEGYEVTRTRNLSDIPALLFILFIVLFYGIWGCINLFHVFSWSRLILNIICLLLLPGYWRNICGVNVGINNLARYSSNTPEATMVWFEEYKRKYVKAIVRDEDN